jgi:NADH dehydrogenase
VLGGGFSGVYAARALERRFRCDTDIEITLVNRENFFLFTPLLHEVASSDIDLTHIVNPLRKLLQRTKIFVGEVRSIDLAAQRVVAAHGYGDGEHAHELEYDQLILALGSTVNYFGLPGLAEKSIAMRSLGDAIRLRNLLIRNLEEADFECCPDMRRRLTTFVVAGAGFAGVETVGAMNDFLRSAIGFYPNLDASDLRVVLAYPGNIVLPELDQKLGEYAGRKLGARGVELRPGIRVTGATPEGVELSDGEFIPTQTLVWTAGSAPHPLLASLPCSVDRGRVKAEATFAVPGWPGVWALGDAAAVADPETGAPYPPTAQHAIRMAGLLAENLAATLQSRPLKPFQFKTIGQLAAIGRRSGVASILGFRFSGILAWILWRTIYLAKLPRIEKKLRVAFDWTVDLFFSKDLVQYHTGLSQEDRPSTQKRNEMAQPLELASA